MTPCSASWGLEKDQMSGIILRGYINSDLNEVDSIYLGIYTTLILTGRTSPAWRILERMTGQGQFIVGNKDAPYAKSMLVKVLKRINMFRYSHATVLHEPGIDNKTIQQCEGHASQDTTTNIYIKGSQMMSD